MNSVNTKRIKQVIIIVGLIITVVGFGSHFLVPGTSRSGLIIQVNQNETVTRSIILDLQDVEYFFGIELLPPGQGEMGNVTAYLLDVANYNLYSSGAPLENVEALLVIENSSRAQYETTVSLELELYLVIENTGTEPTYWSYYYAIIPSTYNVSLSIGFIGIFTVLFGAGWLLTSWKRYFVGGLCVNTLLFFIRIYTLSNYSLGLPDIFWDLIHIEAYNDYQYFYLSWVPNMVEGAWPYSDALYYYIYPPIWIYSVSILGATPSWLPGLILFIFNIAAGPLIYRISFQLTENSKQAIVAMLIYLLNPFTLFYGSFLWLNPTPFVFFMTLAFYYAQMEQETHSIVSLGFATLCKQYSVVLFPILVILFIKRKYQQGVQTKFVEFVRHTLVFAIVIGIVSLPFLIVSPVEYLNRMIFWNTGNYERLTYFIPDSWMTVHANTFFLWLGFPTWFTDAVAVLLINYIFLILCGIAIYGTYSLMHTEKQESHPERYKVLFLHALVWSFIAFICVQIFYPRGAYKFYLLALAPFFAILFDYKIFSSNVETPFRFQKHHIFPLVMSWVVFLCYRFVYFWILALWMAIIMWKSGNLQRIKSNLIAFVTLSFIRKSELDISLSELEEIYSE